MDHAPLTPMDLATLLGRIEHEWESRQRIFDLPTARFWKPDPEIDLSFEFLGRAVPGRQPGQQFVTLLVRVFHRTPRMDDAIRVHMVSVDELTKRLDRCGRNSIRAVGLQPGNQTARWRRGVDVVVGVSVVLVVSRITAAVDIVVWLVLLLQNIETTTTRV